MYRVATPVQGKIPRVLTAVIFLCFKHFLPPATKFGQGYIFTGVCDSVHRGVWSGGVVSNFSWGGVSNFGGGGISNCSGGRVSPIWGGCLQFFGGVSPIFRGVSNFFWGGQGVPIFGGSPNFFPSFSSISLPPQKISSGMHQPPPPRRSMRGRYASYWNAFLSLFFMSFFPQLTFILLPPSTKRYTSTDNIHSKQQSQMRSLLQNFMPSLDCPSAQNWL